MSPLDTEQWWFFVLGTSVPDARLPAQKTSALSSLLALEPLEATHGGLRDAVVAAADKRRAAGGCMK